MTSRGRVRGLPDRLDRADPRRALHDRLERAYLETARSSTRFFEHETPHGSCIGFVGLDAAPMNRVVHPTAATPDDARALVREAAAFFHDRGIPWSIQLTPFTTTQPLVDGLAHAGFRPDARLAVLTLDASPVTLAPPTPRDVLVREIREDDVGLFTSLLVDAFGMPTRYFLPLADVNRDWRRAGARLFVAYRRGRAVGTALLADQDGVSGIYSVCTLRAHRRRRVATALMDATFAAHAESGNDVLTLQVQEGSVAEAFYAKLGFVTQYAWDFHVAPAHVTRR